MKRLTFLLLALCAWLPAQVVNVANPSTQRQVRWCVAPMPLSQADALPAACIVNGRYPAYKAAALGITTQLWHVRCDVAGNGMLTLNDWRPMVGPAPTFALSPWVQDNPDRIVLRVNISEGGFWKTNIQLDKPPTLVASSPVSQTWEMRGDTGPAWYAVHGYSMVVWATTWLGQDAIDIEGAIVWSDPAVQDWAKPDVQFDLVSGKWPTIGEPIALYQAAKNGFIRYMPNGWRLYRGKLPMGVGVVFRGVILPQDDGPLPVTFDAQASKLLDTQRAAYEAAAAEAPLVAACDWTKSPGDWLAFGKVPTTSERADRVAVQAMVARSGNYFDVRPYANAANHGGTGDQPPFGAMKDLIALQGDAWRVWELWDSSLDYWRRCCHLRERDGRRVTKEHRPGMQTWQGTVEPKMSPDSFGKAKADAPYGWDQVGARSVFMDDQHRGDGYELCMYALTGSQLLLESIRDKLAVDSMRAMPARGWFDGPRATGRLMQSWAKVACLTTGADRELALALGDSERGDRQRDQDQWAYNPVHAVEWKGPDPRVLPGSDFCVPWNDALCVMGLIEQAASCKRLGLTEQAARFTSLAEWYGTSIIKWSTVVDNTTGQALPITGLRWLANGAANPSSYYVFPRDGAGFDAGAGIDMLVGSPGWWTWFAGALSVSMDQAGDAETRAKAAAIWAAYATGQQTPRALEWWGCR